MFAALESTANRLAGARGPGYRPPGGQPPNRVSLAPGKLPLSFSRPKVQDRQKPSDKQTGCGSRTGNGPWGPQNRKLGGWPGAGRGREEPAAKEGDS